MSDLEMYKGRPVPYVTAWTSELDPLAGLIAARDLRVREAVDGSELPRLIYADETPKDRDNHGILWWRVPTSPGVGEPDFGSVHSRRQRWAMRFAKCQVCAKDAQLWMIPRSVWQAHLHHYGPQAPITVFDVPVCRPCAQISARQCPALARGGFVFLAPEAWANTAVRAAVADPRTLEFSPMRMMTLPGAAPPTAPEQLRLALARGLLSTLWRASVHQDPDEVAGLGHRVDQVDEAESRRR